MIIDTLSNAEKYFCVHPLFAYAFEYIQSQNLETIEVGAYVIQENQLKAIVSNKPGKTKEESAAKFECHDKHIDIQFCIQGKEKIGWRPRNTCTQLKEEYNVEKDVTFYKDAPDMYFQLIDGQFAIFFPEDVHAPMIGEGDIKKIVIKVKI
ncbi:MAG TPA: YhcH/YjgK/YiaL family protein [Hanamia sp.]|nr:YhcH/YjgK/YiaL family protein [Hanamia sp.]